ncbi:PHP domain-containing protein [Salinicoccus roseus]|uniref:PHP domain-containing protein n=1 Tax=Salinicoccus roseus TaxID=45670 RepID=A0A0C2E2S6_9STAP|nr:PHP domain-containing protein [Salinicoccus roseus]KIH69767.1 phosphoesterase [Salinicoccus roseus]MDB0579217.1 PHP domain-containing protein [Salinicoccus roseus]
MARIDLHVHSTLSDGGDTIDEVLESAHRRGVNVLSFVDHDMTLTYHVAKRKPAARDITLIPGIELSAYDFKRGRKVHVLGYDYNLDGSQMQKLTMPLLERRHQHSLWQIEQIRAYGFDIDAEQVKAQLLPGQTIYKQHIMAALTDAHYATEDYQSLYRVLFKGNGPAAGDIEYMDVHDAVRAVKADGGMAVIAHPGQLDSYDVIEELIPLGLNAIEQYHPDHTEDDVLRVGELCDRYGLVATGGSDYHGDFGAPVEIGLDEGLLTHHPFDEVSFKKC